MKYTVYHFLKFILGCRFTLEAYAKNIKENATNFSLKTTELLLDADRQVLTTKADIYQSIVALGHTNS